MAALYDLMLMLDPNASDERHAEIVGEVRSMIEAKGTLVGAHDWGTRRMAYQIDHRREAGYHLFQFESDPSLLERLRHHLKIADGVLRFRTIRLRPGSPPPPVPRAEPARPREEETTTTVAARAAADAPPAATSEGEPTGPEGPQQPPTSDGEPGGSEAARPTSAEETATP
jgi:small subunit ribosomal protein S6